MTRYCIKTPRSWYFVLESEFNRLCSLTDRKPISIPALDELLLVVSSSSLIRKSCVIL